MSFQIKISSKRKSAITFISQVRKELKRAIFEGSNVGGPNQSEIAKLLEVNRSVVSRELNGSNDITAGRIAELAWALGREAHFELRVPIEQRGTNTPNAAPVRSISGTYYNTDEMGLHTPPSKTVVSTYQEA